jgi:hypothetical protein
LTPLFVFPRKYVSTKMAESRLDPNNRVQQLNNLQHSVYGSKRIVGNPPDILAPTNFPRYVTASVSGNVNSVIVRNFFKPSVFPEIRAHGVSEQDLYFVHWDRHSSHESKALLADFEDQNALASFFPPHATNWLQFQDARDGQFQVMKTKSRKDIDKWNAHLRRKGQTLSMEGFPFVIQNAYRESCKESVARRGLRNIGYFPWNPDAVLSKMPQSKIFADYQQQFSDEANERKQEADKQGSEVASDELEDGSDVKAVEQSGKEDMFYQIASQPAGRSSLAPRPRNYNNGPRLKQDPKEDTFSVLVDVFDFAGQERLRKIQALIDEQSLLPSAVSNPRGRRLGKEGDVFLTSEVTEKRDRVEHDKKERAKTKREIQSKKQGRQKEQEKLVVSLRKELRTEKNARKKIEKTVKQLRARNKKLETRMKQTQPAPRVSNRLKRQTRSGRREEDDEDNKREEDGDGDDDDDDDDDDDKDDDDDDAGDDDDDDEEDEGDDDDDDDDDNDDDDDDDDDDDGDNGQ